MFLFLRKKYIKICGFHSKDCLICPPLNQGNEWMNDYIHTHINNQLIWEKESAYQKRNSPHLTLPTMLLSFLSVLNFLPFPHPYLGCKLHMNLGIYLVVSTTKVLWFPKSIIYAERKHDQNNWEYTWYQSLLSLEITWICFLKKHPNHKHLCTWM